MIQVIKNIKWGNATRYPGMGGWLGKVLSKEKKKLITVILNKMEESQNHGWKYSVYIWPGKSKTINTEMPQRLKWSDKDFKVVIT